MCIDRPEAFSESELAALSMKTVAEITCFFIRHAKAEPVADGLDDAERPLTPAGRRDAKKIFGVLAASRPAIEIIYSSPLLRAKQTADVLTTALRMNGRPVVTPLLAPDAELSAWLEFLQALAASGGRDCAIAAVGHEPTLGRWISMLCFGTARPVNLKKGAIAKVVIHTPITAGGGELCGLYQPSFLRRMAGR